MLRFFTWTMMLCLAGLTWAATGSTARKSTKKASSKSSAGKSSRKAGTSKSAGKSGATKSASKSGKSSKSGATAAKRTTWRNRQMAPAPDRYREIQQALASKGYLGPESATGVWNKESIDALRRFQADQNIESNGKINSLSLIALGLGPKREPVDPKAPVPPPPPAP